MTHTPGPWIASAEEDNEYSRGEYLVYSKEPYRELCLIVGVTGDKAITKANATLIAAAPELLAALEAVIALPGFPVTASSANVYTQCESAIAKAKGVV